MQRMQRARNSLSLATAGLVLGVWACSDLGGNTTTAGTGADEALEREYLQSLVSQVMAPSHARFVQAADAFELAATAHLAAVEAAGDTAATSVALQAAWLDAWGAWQELEMLQIGPAASSAKAVGGQDLRDEVYSWPTTNTCRVDQELVLAGYDAPDFAETRLVNVYGLDAAEYLVFYAGEQNTCAPQLDPNADGSWEALGFEEVTRRRAAYAVAVARGLQAHAATLDAAWREGGEFHVALPGAGMGESPFASTDAAMNEVLRAMFYLDQALKDAKLGVPTGVSDCGSATCLEALESQWANASSPAVVANLRAFEALYYGGFGGPASAGEITHTGLDDLLVSLGEDALAADMADAITDAIAQAEAIEGSYREALVADEAALDALYAAVKRITDLLKGEFSTVLALQIPNEAGGDND